MNVTNNTIPSIIASFKLCLFSLLAICFINLYFIIKNLVKHKKLVKHNNKYTYNLLITTNLF